MKGAVLYGPRDVRFEERGMPKIVEPTVDVAAHDGSTTSTSHTSTLEGEPFWTH